MSSSKQVAVLKLMPNTRYVQAPFENYEVAKKSVPIKRQSLEREPLRLEPHAHQCEQLHGKLFDKHNLLFPDPWHRLSCYYINNAHEIILCSYDAERELPLAQRCVYAMQREDHGDNHEHLVGDYNYTLRFVTPQWALLCDGILTVYLLSTGERQAAEKWQLLSRAPICSSSEQRGFYLYDAHLFGNCINLCAAHAICSGDDEHEHVHLLSCTRWTLDAEQWRYELCAQLRLTGSLSYCAFDSSTDLCLLLCCSGKLQARTLLLPATSNYQLLRFNLRLSAITHSCSLAQSPLFVSSLHATAPGPAAFATRLPCSKQLALWQPQLKRHNVWQLQHVGCLHAIPMEQAAFARFKFIDCCPKLNYLVLSESYRHVCIFKAFAADSQQLAAKQCELSLDYDVGEVLGMATAPQIIFLLTEHALLYLQV